MIAELEAGHLTTKPDQPVYGYCCLVLKRHAIELHELGEPEAVSFMRDMRRVSCALQSVTGAVKVNLELHGNTIPHLHVHFYPRYVGDRFDGRPIDPSESALVLDPEELDGFGAELQTALHEKVRSLR